MKLGIDVMTAYELTPFEISVIGKQRQEKRYVEFENIIALAWHTEALARQKKMPRLDKLIKDIRKKPKKTYSAGDAVLKAMAAEKGVKI
ncbi:MAG TPA: hypothetical protein VIL26_04045 [Clostridia bacterium]